MSNTKYTTSELMLLAHAQKQNMLMLEAEDKLADNCVHIKELEVDHDKLQQERDEYKLDVEQLTERIAFLVQSHLAWGRPAAMEAQINLLRTALKQAQAEAKTSMEKLTTSQTKFDAFRAYAKEQDELLVLQARELQQLNVMRSDLLCLTQQLEQSKKVENKLRQKLITEGIKRQRADADYDAHMNASHGNARRRLDDDFE